MGLRPTVTSNAGGVDTYIDTAYDKIQNVSDNMAALLELNEQFTNLEGIYLGQFGVAPTQRGDTTPLKNGDHYLNTSANTLYFYLEGNWINFKVFYTQDALNTAVGQGPFNIWVAYADDVIGTGISVNPASKDYIGFTNNRTTSQVNITDPSAFTWSKYVGDNAYAHIRYADSLDGTVNFNTTSGDYIGVYTDNNQVSSTLPIDYNWNLIKGIDGFDGTSVTVTDLGNGRKVITGSNGSVYLDDGEVPTLTDNGDGTFTISSGLESVIVTDGVTPLKGIDYYDGNSGEYISFVFAQVAKGDPVPTIDDDTGTYNGTIETYPSGANWTDNAVYSDGMTTYMSKNRYINNLQSGTWALKNSSWSTPSIFLDSTPSVPQIQVKGFAFKRSALPIPLAPTGGTYSDPTPDGWSDGIPEGVLPIYVTSVVFTSDGELPQPAGNPVPWNIPELLAENGQGFKHRFSVNIGGPWSDTPSTNSVYMITSVRGVDGIWVDDVNNVIRIKGEEGTPPQAILKSFCFKRSADPFFLETPTGGSFTSPNPVDGAVTGWSDGIPAGTDTLYVSTRLFTSDGVSPQQNAWAQSQVFTYNGEGFRMVFSIDGLTLWHAEPAPEDVYMQAQTSVDRGVTWVNSGLPIKIKGEAGEGGLSVATIIIYRRSVSLPSTPADDSASYNFGTKAFDVLPADWFAMPPAGIDPVYASVATFSIEGLTGVDSTQTWSTPVVFAQDGDTGSTGPRGSQQYFTTVTTAIPGNPATLTDELFAAAADAVIVAAGNTKQGWDIVTVSDVLNGYSETKYWDQSLNPDDWTVVAQVIDGNLIVLGTIGADKIAANSITADRLDIGVTVTPAALGAEEAGAADVAEVASKAYADGIVTIEEARAIADTIAKADAAQAAAEAASDALGSAAAAETAAIAAADIAAQTKADLAETVSKAYADGIVNDEEVRAIADAIAKADAAEAAAISTAATAANAAVKDDGTVGGWTIEANYIYSGNKQISNTYSTSGITFANSGAIRAEQFYIDYLTGNAFFKGDISGASGTFTGLLSVGATNELNFSGNGDGVTSGARLWVGAALYADAPFRVFENGDIAAEGGTIGGWKLTDSYIHSGSVPKTGNGYDENGITLSFNGGFRSKNFTIDYDTGDAHFKGDLAVGGTISAQDIVAEGNILAGAVSDSDFEESGSSSSATVTVSAGDVVMVTCVGEASGAGVITISGGGLTAWATNLVLGSGDVRSFSEFDTGITGDITYTLTGTVNITDTKILAMVIKK